MIRWMEKIAECLAEDFNLSIHQSRTLLSHQEYDIKKLHDNLKYEFDRTFKNAGLSMDTFEMDIEDTSETLTCDGAFFYFFLFSRTSPARSHLTTQTNKQTIHSMLGQF